MNGCRGFELRGKSPEVDSQVSGLEEKFAAPRRSQILAIPPWPHYLYAMRTFSLILAVLLSAVALAQATDAGPSRQFGQVTGVQPIWPQPQDGGASKPDAGSASSIQW